MIKTKIIPVVLTLGLIIFYFLAAYWLSTKLMLAFPDDNDWNGYYQHNRQLWMFYLSLALLAYPSYILVRDIGNWWRKMKEEEQLDRAIFIEEGTKHFYLIRKTAPQYEIFVDEELIGNAETLRRAQVLGGFEVRDRNKTPEEREAYKQFERWITRSEEKSLPDEIKSQPAASRPSEILQPQGSPIQSQDQLPANLQSGQATQAPLRQDEVVKAQMKRVVGPRMFSMITGETSPPENAVLSTLIQNYQKLPGHIQHELLNTRLPVNQLTEMVKQHAAANPSDEMTQLMAALQNAGGATQEVRKARTAQLKRVVGPRVFSMITGETSPPENKQLNLMMANIDKLPPHVQHQLMKTRLPVNNVVEMLQQHAAENPSEDMNLILAALAKAQSRRSDT